MSCPSCLTALQRADYRDYRSGCIGCDVRRIAQMSPEDRRQALQQVERECGRGAFDRVRLDALREVVRMERLKRLARGG